MTKPDNQRPDLNLTFVRRLLTVYGFLFIWSLLILARLVYLQIFQGEHYRLQAEQQRIGYMELSPKRGDILDRHLGELAISVEVQSVYAHPKEVVDALDAANRCSKILKVDKHEIYKKLISDRTFVYLDRKISPRRAKLIRQLKLPGIYFHKENKRVYPGREHAAHALGFVGVDNNGLAGLEYQYDELLRGERKRVNLRLDARRRSYGRLDESAPVEGDILVLNIDRSIQFIVEQVLQATVDGNQAKSGSSIVMDPNTGEIQAMASYPFFNPNSYARYDAEARRNRTILDIFEPGSTFKVVAFAAVLDEGLADLSETLDCRVGTLNLGGKVYREAKQSFGFLRVEQILAKSSNVGTIKLGLRLGNGLLFDYIERFGFGQKTGIELPAEQAGLLRPPSQWSKISIGALSIGQEIGVTPLQMLRLVATLANGGYLIKPRLIRQILTPQGDLRQKTSVWRRRILNRNTSQEMKKALTKVVQEGTGKRAQLNGYSSAGKTGTAQKFINGAYSDTKFISSYMGFAPVQNPALAAIVVINEPRGAHYGGVVAGPAFKEIMERALIHLKTPQDKPNWRTEKLLTSSRISMGEEERPLGNLEETVLSLIKKDPEKTELEPVIAIVHGAELPDFSGLNLRETARHCAQLGLRLKVTGSGLAIGQRPSPGSRVLKDMVCEVFFSNQRQEP